MAILLLGSGTRHNRPGAIRSETGPVEINLQPRTPLSFAPRGWLVSALTVAVTTVAVVLFAGAISSQDDDGRYTQLRVEVGSASGSGGFPGWYQGIPVLIGVVVVMALAALILTRDARRQLSTDREERRIDTALRKYRARAALTLAAGGITLSLAWVVAALAAGASITVTVPGSDGVLITANSPLAVFAVPLWISGQLLQGLGFALVLLPVFTRRPGRSIRSEVDPAAERPLDGPRQSSAALDSVS